MQAIFNLGMGQIICKEINFEKSLLCYISITLEMSLHYNIYNVHTRTAIHICRN